MRSRRLLVMAVSIPVAFVGCSFSSDNEKPGGAKAAYITQSDAVCTDVIAKSKSAGTGRDQATAQAQTAIWLEASDRLKALTPPQESIEQARQFVTLTENLSMSYQAAAGALQFNDQAKANKAFADVADVRKRAAETADEYGYIECVDINDSTSRS